MNNFTHFDQDGNAVMVDVSGKNQTERVATASGIIKVNQDIMSAVLDKTIQKGDVLLVARVAGIMATKKTSDIIPMCHPLMITKCSIDFEIDKKKLQIKSICTVKINGQTGVEMEALTGVSASLLTIYDMCKAVDKKMEISQIQLEYKSGGKSGEFKR